MLLMNFQEILNFNLGFCTEYSKNKNLKLKIDDFGVNRNAPPIHTLRHTNVIEAVFDASILNV